MKWKDEDELAEATKVGFYLTKQPFKFGRKVKEPSVL